MAFTSSILICVATCAVGVFSAPRANYNPLEASDTDYNDPFRRLPRPPSDLLNRAFGRDGAPFRPPNAFGAPNYSSERPVDDYEDNGPPPDPSAQDSRQSNDNYRSEERPNDSRENNRSPERRDSREERDDRSPERRDSREREDSREYDDEKSNDRSAPRNSPEKEEYISAEPPKSAEQSRNRRPDPPRSRKQPPPPQHVQQPGRPHNPAPHPRPQPHHDAHQPQHVVTQHPYPKDNKEHSQQLNERPNQVHHPKPRPLGPVYRQPDPKINSVLPANVPATHHASLIPLRRPAPTSQPKEDQEPHYTRVKTASGESVSSFTKYDSKDDHSRERPYSAYPVVKEEQTTQQGQIAELRTVEYEDRPQPQVNRGAPKERYEKVVERERDERSANDDRKNSREADDRKNSREADDRKNSRDNDDRKNSRDDDDRNNSREADDRKNSRDADDRKNSRDADDRKNSRDTDDRKNSRDADDKNNSRDADDRKNSRDEPDRREEENSRDKEDYSEEEPEYKEETPRQRRLRELLERRRQRAYERQLRREDRRRALESTRRSPWGRANSNEEAEKTTERVEAEPEQRYRDDQRKGNIRQDNKKQPEKQRQSGEQYEDDDFTNVPRFAEYDDKPYVPEGVDFAFGPPPGVTTEKQEGQDNEDYEEDPWYDNAGRGAIDSPRKASVEKQPESSTFAAIPTETGNGRSFALAPITQNPQVPLLTTAAKIERKL